MSTEQNATPSSGHYLGTPPTPRDPMNRRTLTLLEKMVGWTLGLVAVIALASVIVAVAAVMTAVNTRELCESAGGVSFLGSSCSP